ncbi:calcium/proton exchanger [Dehalogenimonas etheniformans]|nr:calcium/proton exchanger [Dehalogenimonas etheniformans]QNT76016.1 calcium/proton exchanger [Dehalogenimonas etheniformans]
MSIRLGRIQLHRIDFLLLFVPLSLACYLLKLPAIVSFTSAAAAVVAISHLMVEATGIISQRVSSTISALINATFGNAIEFMIAIFALRAGLETMVKASITGSIILNVLFLIGLSMVAGGMKYKEQRFNKDSAGLSSTMLIIIVVGLAMPSMYSILVGKPAQDMSIAVSVILGVIYLLSLFYTLVTHKHLFIVKREAPPSGSYRPWPFRVAVAILLISAIAAGFESSLIVDSITPLIDTLGITQTFAGLVLIALLTNIPEQISAARFARLNNMTLSLEIGMSSALQIALFVVPVLVLLSSTLTGSTMDLVLSPFELISLVMTAMIANYISADGICHWLEGAQLLAVYALIATAFFFI